jgi:O-Antigen ligase
MSHTLEAAGVLLASGSAAAALLLPPSPRRSLAMLVALALIPVLLLGNQWHSSAISDLRDHPARLATAIVIAAAIAISLALIIRSRPILMPLALIAALPFRIPLHAGGDQANLLVPLYLVLAGAVLATAWRQWNDRASLVADDPEQDSAASSAGDARVGDPRRPQAKAEDGGGVPRGRTRGLSAASLLPKLLVAAIVLYALQSLYSEDFSRALQNAAFFYVPFALLYTLLADCRWDRRLLAAALAVVVAEGVVFALVGFVEYATRHLLWNHEVITSNDFHTYFRVNSLFWDPNIYGRFMALVVTALAAALLWAERERTAILAVGAGGVLFLGLASTYSQSSFIALLAGLAVLAALRWSLRWTVLACGGAVLVTLALVLAAGTSLKIDLSKVNSDTSGRANLISGGVHLFGDRPLQGYGAGSFGAAYRNHRSHHRAAVTVSHTEPITVGAEQGLIGLTLYAALLITAFATLLGGARTLMPGLRSPPGRAHDAWLVAARAAVLAAFTALIVHTLFYAGFLEDPATWVLLAIGASLAVASSSGERLEAGSAAPVTAAALPAR